jgi:peptidoglycan/LPS O-acetylase OafA/YrhL
MMAAAGILAAVVPLMILWPGILGIFDVSWLAISYGLLVLAAAVGNLAPLSSFLRQPVWLALGRYSYAIYMFHQLISGLLHGWILKQEPLIRNWQGALTTLAALLATLALAWLSFRFLESPFLKLGQRFRYRPDGGTS